MIAGTLLTVGSIYGIDKYIHRNDPTEEQKEQKDAQSLVEIVQDAVNKCVQAGGTRDDCYRQITSGV